MFVYVILFAKGRGRLDAIEHVGRVARIRHSVGGLSSRLEMK